MIGTRADVATVGVKPLGKKQEKKPEGDAGAKTDTSDCVPALQEA